MTKNTISRDPNKTARNKAILRMKEELRKILPLALKETLKDNELSLNAFIGHKIGLFIDLKNEIITSPEEYVSKWLQGLTRYLENGHQGAVLNMHDQLRKQTNVNFRKYCEIFLKRSFLNHYDELSKKRPGENDSHFWFGLNDSFHGIYITPRFNSTIMNWENDNSEIRAFPKKYWTIGHVLKTGLCYYGSKRIYRFDSVDAYLNYFYNQVRLTKSNYQIFIAEKYISYVENSLKPEEIPLLIPELRFNDNDKKHEHRLDFLIINPYTMDKVGYEFSPWSTHGQLSGKHKTLKELNEEAKRNFEKEINKMKAYYKKHNIYTLIYTDMDLIDLDVVFEDMKKHLSPSEPPVQLALNLIDDYFGIS